MAFIQHFQFFSLNIRKLFPTEEEKLFFPLFPFRGETWQRSFFFSLVVNGSSPSPGEISLVGKVVSLLVFGLADVCPLWMGLSQSCLPRGSSTCAITSLPPNKIFLMCFLFLPFQISVSPGRPYFQTPLKLTLQQLFTDLDSWHLAFLFISLPLFHL